MKRVSFLILSLLCLANLQAREGSSCDNAIPVEVSYSGTFAEGEYWFTANTMSLPLTFYYYPEDTTAQAPEVWLDLTCTPGVYDDPNVANMLKFAGDYGLSFPMKEVPDKQIDEEGRVFYSILYDRNYRDMLYNQGVTYAVPAYVRFVNHTQATVNIVSKSVNSMCRDYVNTFRMDAQLLYAPSDSVYVHLWPLGEWIKYNYRITWTGEGALDFYDGTTCQLTKTSYTRDHFILPDETIDFTPDRTSAWIKDIYQTDLYVRLYAETEGVLKIESYERVNRLLEVIVAGISAAIDHQAHTITVVLPAGTTRANIIKALKAAEFRYVSYDDSEPQLNKTATQLTFGDATYTISATAAPVEGNTDATLASLTIDGFALDGFSPATLRYDDVEVVSSQPLVAATPTVPTSTVEITQASSLPATVTVIVTAEAGNQQTYTLHLIAGRSKDATLSAILLDGEPLASFSSDQYTYRLPVSHLPKVTAVAADTKAAITIEQAKGIPGFAQVRVTAEAGNTQNYTANFVMDPRFQPCLGETETLQLETPVLLSPDDADKVLNIPIKDWTEQMIRFTWSGTTDLMVYLGTSCFFDPHHPDETMVDSFLLALPVGEESRHYDFRPADLKELARLSLDGTLYLRFGIQGEGQLSVTEWTETCLTQSRLLTLPSLNEIVSSSAAKYRFYLPDWAEHDVRLIWRGESECKTFIADACDFYLTDNNIHVLRPSPFHFIAGEDSVDIDVTTLADWAFDADGGFIYMRFVNRLPGTLEIKRINSGIITNTDAIAGTCLQITPLSQGWQFLSPAEQQLTVYALDGRYVTSVRLQPNTPVSLYLPAGVYIAHHTDGVYKLISQ